MKKKSVSHIENIIAFSIFLIFITFMIIYLSPLRVPRSSSYILDVASNKFQEAYSVRLKEYTLVLSSEVLSVSESCITFPAQKFEPSSPIGKYVIKNDSGVIESDLENNNIEIQKPSSRVFYVYVSEESIFSPPSADYDGCLTLSDDNYSIIQGVSFYPVSEEKVKSATDYLAVKKTLGIPDSFDFELILVDMASPDKPLLNLSKQKPITNVLAREYPLSMITSKGDIKNMVFSIKIW